MNAKLYLIIASRTLMLYVIATISNYAMEYLHQTSFFGDKWIDSQSGGYYEYGTRHIMFGFMAGAMFILAFINAVMATFNDVKKYYPDLDL